MDDWQPDEVTNIDGRRAYFWLIPAKVAGTWRFQSGSDGLDVTLEQKYQTLEGTVKLGTVNAGLRDARLAGDKISFAFVDQGGVRRDFTGKVSGNTMEGHDEARDRPRVALDRDQALTGQKRSRRRTMSSRFTRSLAIVLAAVTLTAGGWRVPRRQAARVDLPPAARRARDARGRRAALRTSCG